MSNYPYRIQEVRDLAWACFSPPIADMQVLVKPEVGVDNCEFELTDRRRKWLESLDSDPSSLFRHLANRRSNKLGIYFESLWQYFLSADDEVELVAANLPVHERGRTLGEFDCIYFCHRRNCHVHLELAAKFYLAWHAKTVPGAGGEWSQWYGPNARDRLDIKINHLLEHQIKLGAHAAAKESLKALGISRLRREIGLKGYLFTHGQAAPTPTGLVNERRLHRWLRLGEIATTLADSAANTYLPLPRKRWLSPAWAEPTDTVMDISELLRQLETAMLEASRPRLVAALDKDGVEVERFFVTDQEWPSL